MKPSLLLAVVFAVSTTSSAPAESIPDAEKLMAQLRPVLSRPSTFQPASLRFPPRLDLQADLKAARAEAELHPDDIEARRRLARLLEQAEDESAEAVWREVLEADETQLRKRPTDAGLLEQAVEAMVGADLGARVVPPAEQLRTAAPKRWQAQLLYGDARMRRADFNWRVCVRLGDRAQAAPQYAELLGDVEAAGSAYQRAVELAPAEPAVRGARISLAMARVVMGNFLPKGALAGAEQIDIPAMQKEIVDLCRANPRRFDSLWHATHFLAAFGHQERPLTPADREFFQQTLAAATPDSGADRIFLDEARGMWAASVRDWGAARQAFEAARRNLPTRRFSAPWLVQCDAHATEPASLVIERVRDRLKSGGSTEDYALLGALLSKPDPESAIVTLRKAIELDVDNANARHNLALLLLRRRADSTEARHHLRQALELEPDNLEARLAQAVTAALDGGMAAARQHLQNLQALPQSEDHLKERIAAVLALIGEPTRQRELNDAWKDELSRSPADTLKAGSRPRQPGESKRSSLNSG